jgi:hypothetical protein
VNEMNKKYEVFIVSAATEFQFPEGQTGMAA